MSELMERGSQRDTFGWLERFLQAVRESQAEGIIERVRRKKGCGRDPASWAAELFLETLLHLHSEAPTMGDPLGHIIDGTCWTERQVCGPRALACVHSCVVGCVCIHDMFVCPCMFSIVACVYICMHEELGVREASHSPGRTGKHTLTSSDLTGTEACGHQQTCSLSTSQSATSSCHSLRPRSSLPAASTRNGSLGRQVDTWGPFCHWEEGVLTEGCQSGGRWPG